jgi:c(7)-type cytochrome triheme protein
VKEAVMRTRTSLFGLALAAGLAAAVSAGSLARLPEDRPLPRSADSPGPVVFSHRSHVDERRPDCTVCHPGRFSILRRHDAAILHADMEQGKSCGSCHDGKNAHGLDDCSSCHGDE